MPILPVLDLKEGAVVRGIAGRRAEYRHVVSQLTASAAPRDVARALRETFGFTEFYVADLDAIGGAAPAVAIYDALHQDGYRLWVDAGVRDAADAASLVDAKVECIVAGLESVAGPRVLTELCDRYGPDRVVFSLDLKAGAPLGEWGETDPWEIARRAVDAGVRRLLVLDLARVGVGTGVGTEALCHRLRAAYPDVRLAAGGGVRGPADVRLLHECGVEHVLVASALHDGRITRADLAG